MARNTRTGTATWVPSDKRWRIRVTRDGVRRPFYSSTPGKKGQKEANAAADKWLEHGTHDETTKIAVLWEDYLANLLNMDVLPDDYEERLVYFRKHNYQFSQHEGIGRNWILPKIGHKRLCDLNEQDLQNILNSAKAAGRTKKTTKHIQAAQNAFLKFCRRNRYTIFRPEEVKIPGGMRTKKKPVINTREDVYKLFTCDMTILNGIETFERLVWGFRFDFIMGFRPGELVGLQWKDINGNKLTINRSINCRGLETPGKTDRANDDLIIPKIGMYILDQQRKLNPPEYNLWVFDHYMQGTYLKRWNRYCEYNGIIKCSLKEMRHACVSWLKNLPKEILKGHIRHTDDMPTVLTYGHEVEGDAELRAEAVNNMFLEMLPFLEEAEIRVDE